MGNLFKVTQLRSAGDAQCFGPPLLGASGSGENYLDHFLHKKLPSNLPLHSIGSFVHDLPSPPIHTSPPPPASSILILSQLIMV